MNEIVALILAVLATYVTNIPFGYWRQGVKKFSWQWFLFVHLPIPLVIAYRYLFGLGFQFYTYPFMILGFFGGQWTGAQLRKRSMTVGKED
jgi:hypothetical protein